MTPATLRAISRHAALEDLFEKAKAGARYDLNALPEERVDQWLVEALAPVLVRLESYIEQICLVSDLPPSPDWTHHGDGTSHRVCAGIGRAA